MMSRRGSGPVPKAAADHRLLFYERFADEFDARMNQYEVTKRLRLIYEVALAGHDLTGRELLDAGCGTGPSSAAPW
jgi:predicted RNA methylase